MRVTKVRSRAGPKAAGGSAKRRSGFKLELWVTIEKKTQGTVRKVLRGGEKKKGSATQPGLNTQAWAGLQ